jgi:two-component system sensor histidine kinase YesM
MSARATREERGSISASLRRLICGLAVPLCLLALFLLLQFFLYGLRQARISSNISTASQFNRDFKNEVDLKMYYFVTGSSEGLPLDEVETAEELATTLLGSTSNRESRRAASSVLNLCGNLKSRISDIEAAEDYDSRMHQLEANVYVITELIQDYMYTYLYYEAGELAALRERQTSLLTASLLLSAFVMAAVVALSLRQSFRLSRSITRPIDGLYSRVEEIGRGDLTVRPPVEAQDSKLRALGEGLEEMAARLDEQMELNRQEQARLRSMELALVQAQINPHFLYNTLDAIVWLVETGKNEQAVEMVSSLSNYFRSFLSNGQDVITLREEALHVRSYLEIQQVRYKDILRCELSMDPELEECRIPKMTLQPLVENAVYHGIKLKRGGGVVSIVSRREGAAACLEVRDTGLGMSEDTLRELRRSLEEDKGTGFGMLASYRRLKLMYGEALDFRVDSAENLGTTVTIRFPLRNEEEL